MATRSRPRSAKTLKSLTTETTSSQTGGSVNRIFKRIGAFFHKHTAKEMVSYFRIQRVVILDGCFLASWFFIDVFIHLLAAWAKRNGADSGAMWAAKVILPWGILCLVLIKVAKDVIKESKTLAVMIVNYPRSVRNMAREKIRKVSNGYHSNIPSEGSKASTSSSSRVAMSRRKRMFIADRSSSSAKPPFNS